MTLQDYIDMIRFELKDEKLPQEYLRREINSARRRIAYLTRCLECRSYCKSEKDVNEYQIPRAENDSDLVDIIEVLDVHYDGVLLEWINNWEMRHYLQFNSSGPPDKWSYFGGAAQPTGYLILNPTPDQNDKEILIHSIQYPKPLISTADKCELQDGIQDLVRNQVEGLIMLKKWHPQGATLINMVAREIKNYIKLKTA